MITANDQASPGAPQANDRSQDAKASTETNQNERPKLEEKASSLRNERIFDQRPSRLNEINVKHESHQVKLRARQLTVCLFFLVGAISSLTPFLSLHLTNRVGLLLFESDLLQLRSSLASVIICLTFLVILDLIIVLLSKARLVGANRSSVSYLFRPDKKQSLLLQKVLRQLTGLLAIVSILSYSSLALIVPHIHQQQRMPFATFDCNANLITIENCQQQFSTHNNERLSLLDSIRQLIVGDLNGNSGSLAERLECLKYNDESLERLHVPTRFLLSKCGLICEPQRQQLHQFGDDLNSDFGPAEAVTLPENGPGGRTRQLVAPYSQLDYNNQQVPINGTPTSETQRASESDIVSLKLCFSGEITGESSSSSNYMRFCIENLTSGGKSRQPTYSSPTNSQNSFSQHQSRDQTLTVGQLNAILSRVHLDEGTATSGNKQSNTPSHQHHQESANLLDSSRNLYVGRGSDQSTHYVNPIVQFESHFKNWPHLSRASTAFTSNDGYLSEKWENDSANLRAPSSSSSWCKFKPVPPFIVNNKPFSGIHCSLEHDYLMSTDASQRQSLSIRRRRFQRASTPKIYLRKSTSLNEFTHGERCNIGCQVNILYQVHHNPHTPETNGGGSKQGDVSSGSLATSYYLPLKSCLIVEGDKDQTSHYYLWIRAIADASLLLTFILVDILLMLESVDTKQFQLEGKKVRLLGLLLAIFLLPLLVAALFDLTASWLPSTSQTKNYREGYLVQFLNERLIPSLSELFSKVATYFKPAANAHQHRHQQPEDLNATSNYTHLKQQDVVVVDNYLVPFFIYAILMFAFAINSFKLPLVASTSTMVRVTSTEELGMVRTAVKSPSRESGDKRAFQDLSRPDQQAIKMGSLNKTKSLDALSSLRSASTQFNKKDETLEDKLASLKRSMTNSLIRQKQREAAEEKSSQMRSKSSKRSIVLFAMLTLFMGLQFNLSQITQTQILIESFNIQSDLNQQQQQSPSTNYERPTRVATSFVLVANSCGTVFVLILALVFSDELSIFLAEYFPFKPVPKVDNDLSLRQNSLRFKKHLSISLIIYSLRYFVLANMAPQMSKMKWFLAILFQFTELLNFPLTWFQLTSRAHELLIKGQQSHEATVSAAPSGVDQPKSFSPSGSLEAKASNVHLLLQSTMAFVYFALARFLALFVHSLHASLYLHSDAVDWFIETFYDQATAASLRPTMNGKPISQNQQQASVMNVTSPASDSLFIPLPSERQTYLHASRSFIRYNSLVCLLMGVAFLAVFAYGRYRLWIDQKRLELIQKRNRSPESERESDLIDEQLSLDLMRVRSAQPARRDDSLRRHKSETTVFTHAPRTIASDQLRRQRANFDSTTDEDGHPPPRARIHFRYDLGLHGNSSSSSSSSSTSSTSAAFYPGKSKPRRGLGQRGSMRDLSQRMPVRPQHVGVDQAASATSSSRVIPMILEEEPTPEERTPEDSRGQTTNHSSTEEEVEQFTRTRSARMLVEDEENWSLEGDQEGEAQSDKSTPNRFVVDPLLAARSPPPPGFGDDDDEYSADNFRQHTSRQVSEVSGFDLGPPPEFDETSPRLTPFREGREEQAQRSALASPLTTEHQQQQQQQRRRITFGPTTTFIDRERNHGDQHSTDDAPMVGQARGPSAERPQFDMQDGNNRLFVGQRHGQTGRLLASPEPSIDDDEDERDDVDQRGFQEIEDNNYWRETSRTTTRTMTTTTANSGARARHLRGTMSGRDSDSIDE